MVYRDDDEHIDIKIMKGMIFRGLHNQTVFEARKTCDWTGKVIDRAFGLTENEAISNLK